MCVLVLAFPRRWALVPMLFVGVWVTEIQRVVVIGLDFTMLRLLFLAAFIRIIMRREHVGFRRVPLDTAMLAFVALDCAAYLALRGGSTAAFVSRMGFAYNTLAIYFFVRVMVRDKDELLSLVTAFAFVSALPLAVSMTVEQLTGRNLFWVFGGVPEFTPLRDGALRSQGSFPHPLLAGAFGGSLFPLFWLLARRGRPGAGFVGMLCSVAIALLSFSSGPILALLAGIAGLLLWRVRHSARTMRWSVVLGLVCIAQVMKAPVWALVSRFGIFEASTGYHRFALIDQAIKRFGEWWLLGTVDTSHWGWGLWDVTNQYLAVGVEGGFITMIAFMVLLGLGFRNVGRATHGRMPLDQQYDLWAFGSVLFAHCVAFVGMAYFGAQIYVNLCFTLAALAMNAGSSPAAEMVPQAPGAGEGAPLDAGVPGGPEAPRGPVVPVASPQ